MPRRVPNAVRIAALIAGFMALGLYAFTVSALRAAQRKVSQQRVVELDRGLTQYLLDTRRCPTSTADLVRMGYVRPGALHDAWKMNITVSCSAAGPFVRSAGADKVFDTADDISSTPFKRPDAA
jgi:hypothetical protein